MREGNISPWELVPSQLCLHGRDLSDQLIRRELGTLPPPIYVREFGSNLYILDGHHRTAQSMIHTAHIDILIVENYHDCNQANRLQRAILHSSYDNISKKRHPKRSLRPDIVKVAPEVQRELLGRRLTMEQKYSVREAIRRASDRLEDWVSEQR